MAYKVPKIEDVRKAARENGVADSSEANLMKAISFMSEYRDQVCEWAIGRAVELLEDGTRPVASVSSADVASGYLSEHVDFEEAEREGPSPFPIPLSAVDAAKFDSACAACILHDVARSFVEGGYPAYVASDRVDVYLPAQPDGEGGPRGQVAPAAPVFQQRG